MNRSALVVSVIALALAACSGEPSGTAVPPPASTDPFGASPTAAQLPPNDVDPGECGGESATPAANEENLDGCLPPDAFGDGIDDAADRLAPGAVRLTVSNQSFAEPTVHLVIRIDGEVIADEDFDVGDQHNWVSFDVTDLAPGEHTLTVESATGDSLEQSFTLPDDEGLYLYVDFWEGPGANPFSYTESDVELGLS